MPPTDPAFTIFIDRSLGAHDVPGALRAAGARVEVHDEHFAADTPDTDWRLEAGKRGWVVLAKDNRIRRHPLELQALLAAGVAAFMCTATELTGAEMGRLLVAALPRIAAIVPTRARPFIATISRRGPIAIIQGGGRRGGIRKR